MEPRKTSFTLYFTGERKDVTQDIITDLLSLSYTDKETDEADELSLTLKDPHGIWAGTWSPDGGEKMEAYIYAGDVSGKEDSRLYCGKFFVDSLSTSGSPRVLNIRAVSIPLNKPIRRKLKTRAWEKTALKDIAAAIAKEAGMALLYDAQDNPVYDRQDQKRESDLQFLSRLSREMGISLKVTDEKIVMFDQASYEKKEPVKVLTLKSSPILSWSFESSQSEKYKSVTVAYRDPKQKKKGTAAGYNMDLEKAGTKKSSNPAVMTYTYTDPDASDQWQEYSLKRRAKSVSDAERIAKAKLRELNARSVTGSISLVGDPSLVAGVVVAVSGFGSFDGNFIVQEATHSVSSGGYTTSLLLRRVNNNY